MSLSVGRIVNHNVVQAVGGVMSRYLNYDLADCLPKHELAMILGLAKYSSRALCITEPEDIIQLDPVLRDQVDSITAHYRRVGLPCTDQIIWSDEFAKAKDYPERELSVFFFGSRAHQARSDQGWFDTAERMNHKNEFIRLCHEMNLPVPETHCFDCKSRIKDLRELKYPLRFKLSFSVSGLGISLCENAEDLSKCLEEIPEGVAFQLQEDLPASTVWLNVQYQGNGKAKRMLLTEQVLDGNSHAGNKHPSSCANIWNLTDPLAERLSEQGLKGVFAFDVAVCHDRKLLIECNPRFNGSTYPTIISTRLNIPQWISKNFMTKYRNIAELPIEELEYRPEVKKGVIVFNWGSVDEGKLGIMLCGNQDEQFYLEKALETILS